MGETLPLTGSNAKKGHTTKDRGARKVGGETCTQPRGDGCAGNKAKGDPRNIQGRGHILETEDQM